MSDPRDPSYRDDPDEGMMDLAEYERLHPIPQEEQEAPVEDPDALPTVSPERLAELKQRARDMIEERLRNKRKQRRLMRGGRT